MEHVGQFVGTVYFGLIKNVMMATKMITMDVERTALMWKRISSATPHLIQQAGSTGLNATLMVV